MRRWLGALLSLSLIAACGWIPEKLAWKDPRLVPLLTAMASVDRQAMGFTPLQREDQLRLETRPRSGYDAMLHVDGQTSRTIAFKKVGEAYRWIGEQERFFGPRSFDTVDGKQRETICITFEKTPISGAPLNTLFITFHGIDVKGAESTRSGLGLLEAQAMIKPWMDPRGRARDAALAVPSDCPEASRMMAQWNATANSALPPALGARLRDLQKSQEGAAHAALDLPFIERTDLPGGCIPERMAVFEGETPTPLARLRSARLGGQELILADYEDPAHSRIWHDDELRQISVVWIREGAACHEILRSECGPIEVVQFGKDAQPLLTQGSCPGSSYTQAFYSLESGRLSESAQVSSWGDGFWVYEDLDHDGQLELIVRSRIGEPEDLLTRLRKLGCYEAPGPWEFETSAYRWTGKTLVPFASYYSL